MVWTSIKPKWLVSIVRIWGHVMSEFLKLKCRPGCVWCFFKPLKNDDGKNDNSTCSRLMFRPRLHFKTRPNKTVSYRSALTPNTWKRAIIDFKTCLHHRKKLKHGFPCGLAFLFKVKVCGGVRVEFCKGQNSGWVRRGEDLGHRVWRSCVGNQKHALDSSAPREQKWNAHSGYTNVCFMSIMCFTWDLWIFSQKDSEVKTQTVFLLPIERVLTPDVRCLESFVLGHVTRAELI